MIHIHENQYLRLRDDYSGICLACFSVAIGNIEPDAENYICESCDEPRVQGIDNLLIMGLINIDDTVEKPFVRLKSRKTGEITEKPLLW